MFMSTLPTKLMPLVEEMYKDDEEEYQKKKKQEKEAKEA
jgi:hypothetical protein